MPTTEAQLKELAGELRAALSTCTINQRSRYPSIELTREEYARCHPIGEALTLAIGIAEAIGKNPRGFMNWAKTTGGDL